MYGKSWIITHYLHAYIKYLLFMYFKKVLNEYKIFKVFFLKRQGSEELSAQCYKDWEKVEQ